MLTLRWILRIYGVRTEVNGTGSEACLIAGFGISIQNDILKNLNMENLVTIIWM
jgi:hypothetical protein